MAAFFISSFILSEAFCAEDHILLYFHNPAGPTYI